MRAVCRRLLSTRGADAGMTLMMKVYPAFARDREG